MALAITIALTACAKHAAKDENAAESGAHVEHAGEKKEEDHKGGEEALTLTADEATPAGIKVEGMQPPALSKTVVVTATIDPD